MPKTPSVPSGQETFDVDKRKTAQDDKATRFDGDPNPKGSKSDVFKPKDDTPFRLKKKDGPANPQGRSDITPTSDIEK